jgi:hypothetical protein
MTSKVVIQATPCPGTMVLLIEKHGDSTYPAVTLKEGEPIERWVYNGVTLEIVERHEASPSGTPAPEVPAS